MSRRLGVLGQTVVLCLLLMAVFSAGSLVLLDQLSVHNAADRAEHRANVAASLARQVNADLLDIQVGLQEFALTGRRAPLARAAAGKSMLLRKLARLGTMAAGDVNAENLRAAVANYYVAYLRPVLDTSRTDLAGARRVAASGKGLEGLGLTKNRTRDLIGSTAQRVQVESDRVDAAIHHVATVIVGLIALVLAGIALAGAVIARRIAVPLKRLGSAVEQVGAGDLGVLLPEQGIRDTRLLASAFNGMVASLARVRATVDEQREELRTSEEHFRVLVQNASDMVTVVADDGSIEYQSPASNSLLGLAPGSMEGGSLTDLIHPGDVNVVSDLSDALEAGRPGRARLRWRRSDGSWMATEAAVGIHPAGSAGRRVIVTSRDITEREAFEEEQRRLALHDPLTKLPSRALFMDRVGYAFRKRAPGAGPGVLFVDIDRFKEVNDSLGHDAGDEMIRFVAEQLAGALNHGDTVARLGSDEFGVLLAGATNEEDIASAVDRIREGGHSTRLLNGRVAAVTLSIGAALREPGAGMPADLVGEADTAMYAAKRGGGGRFALFGPALQAATIAQKQLQDELEHVAESGQLRAHYQPIFDLVAGRIVAMEALVRWQHPVRGLLMPGEFLPAAEQSGAIVAIDSWMLAAACNQIREWNDRGVRAPLGVQVNLGALDLADPGLVERVQCILTSAGLDPHRLTIEVTETVVMADLDETALQLEALERLGVRIALDDFGTGYSSLSYLQRLPISVLKVDRSLVSGARRRERSILRSVADLGQSLAMQVVLEGVEGPRELELARELGCGFGQGFHLGRPLDPESAWRTVNDSGGSLPDLPVVTDADVAARALLTSYVPPAGSGDSSLILVVDDHLATLELFGALLEASGYQALLALTGPEALRKAHEHIPQLVITDLHMPGMDGAELAGAMKADPALRDIPVVMCTRFEADQIAEPGDLGNFDDELAKPPNPNAAWLGSQVKLLLERHAVTTTHELRL